jgi:hypothetical protein
MKNQIIKVSTGLSTATLLLLSSTIQVLAAGRDNGTVGGATDDSLSNTGNGINYVLIGVIALAVISVILYALVRDRKRYE